MTPFAVTNFFFFISKGPSFAQVCHSVCKLGKAAFGLSYQLESAISLFSFFWNRELSNKPEKKKPWKESLQRHLHRIAPRLQVMMFPLDELWLSWLFLYFKSGFQLQITGVIRNRNTAAQISQNTETSDRWQMNQRDGPTNHSAFPVPGNMLLSWPKTGSDVIRSSNLNCFKSFNRCE